MIFSKKLIIRAILSLILIIFVLSACNSPDQNGTSPMQTTSVGATGVPVQGPVGTPNPTYWPSQKSTISITQPVFKPETLMQGVEGSFSVQILGNRSDPSCWGIPGKPVDAVFIFDISTSAGRGPGSNWERTVQFTQDLLGFFSRPIYSDPFAGPGNSKIALVSSQTGTNGPEPVLLQELTDNFQVLSEKVSKLQTEGDTNIVAGLQMALKQIRPVENRRQAIFLMLHDNVMTNTNDNKTTLSAIKDAQTADIEIYIIGNSFNLHGQPPLTREVASQAVPADQVYIDPRPENLRELFLQSTGINKRLAARNLWVVQEIQPGGVLSYKDLRGGAMNSKGQLTWSVPALEFERDTTLGFNFQVNGNAGSLKSMTGLAWLDCNGYPQFNNLQGGLANIQLIGNPAWERVIAIGSEGIPALPSFITPIAPQQPGGIQIGELQIDHPEIWFCLIPLVLLLLRGLVYILSRRSRGQTQSGKQNGPIPINPKPIYPPKINPPDGYGKFKGTKVLPGNDMNADYIEDVKDHDGDSFRLWIGRLGSENQNKFKDRENFIRRLNIMDPKDNARVVDAEVSMIPDKETDRYTGERQEFWRMEINKLEVKVGFRRKGLGTLLLERVERLAKDHSAVEIRFACDTPEAEAFAKANGYTVENRDRKKVVFKNI